jgi:hypothetical protein
VIACDRRYRILNGVYRGHLISHPEFLAAALKIIMHTNYMYTKDHPQRTHRPFALPRLAVRAAPVAPAIDTGITFGDLEVADRVLVWWLDAWWHAKVTYKSVRLQTITVKFTGDDIATSGILPKMIKLID